MTKGNRYRVTPNDNMDNLVKFIDGSKPGDMHHIMLAVDQHDQVYVWQLRTISHQEVITIDYRRA